MRIIPPFNLYPRASSEELRWARIFRCSMTSKQQSRGHRTFVSVTLHGLVAMHSRTLLPLQFLAFVQVVVSQFKCDPRMYGRPKMEDCASAYLAMPDSRITSPTPTLEEFRRFVEPQLLEPPFAAVENDLGAAMEQIPKFWRYSKPASSIFTALLTKGVLTQKHVASLSCPLQLLTAK